MYWGSCLCAHSIDMHHGAAPDLNSSPSISHSTHLLEPLLVTTTRLLPNGLGIREGREGRSIPCRPSRAGLKCQEKSFVSEFEQRSTSLSDILAGGRGWSLLASMFVGTGVAECSVNTPHHNMIIETSQASLAGLLM